jgi:hypothetical protein
MKYDQSANMCYFRLLLDFFLFFAKIIFDNFSELTINNAAFAHRNGSQIGIPIPDIVLSAYIYAPWLIATDSAKGAIKKLIM